MDRRTIGATMLALMAMGQKLPMDGSVGIKGEDINVPTDPKAGEDARLKDEANATRFPNAKTRKRFGLPKPPHVPEPKRKGYHRKKR